MRLLPVLFLFSIILLLTVPATALSPAQIPKISVAQTTKPFYDIGQKITVTTTKPDEPGELYINSFPPGAEIYYNISGSTFWQTPEKTPWGTKAPRINYADGIVRFEILIIKAGYQPYYTEVTVENDMTYKINAVLVPFTAAGTQSTVTSPGVPGTLSATQNPFVPQATVSGAVISPTPGTSQAAQPPGQPSQSPVPGTGSLSVSTNPSGAVIEIDGIPAGVSPAIVPGLAAGNHYLMITMTGYEALITQVNIVGGQTMEYSTALVPATNPTQKQTPGFEAAVAGLAIACLIFLKRTT